MEIYSFIYEDDYVSQAIKRQSFNCKHVVGELAWQRWPNLQATCRVNSVSSL